MADRLRRLRTWLASARSTVLELTWEARFWFAVGVIGVVWRPLRESVPAIFFMSAWALYRNARLERREVEREQVETRPVTQWRSCGARRRR